MGIYQEILIERIIIFSFSTFQKLMSFFDPYSFRIMPFFIFHWNVIFKISLSFFYLYPMDYSKLVISISIKYHLSKWVAPAGVIKYNIERWFQVLDLIPSPKIILFNMNYVFFAKIDVLIFSKWIFYIYDFPNEYLMQKKWIIKFNKRRKIYHMNIFH